MHKNILSQRADKFKIKLLKQGDYFTQQDAYLTGLINQLQHYVVDLSCISAEDKAHELLQLLRQFVKQGGELSQQDKKIRKEIERVLRLSRLTYSFEKWFQEDLNECLKRLRCDLITFSFRDKIHQIMPRAIGPRIAYLRAPQPVNIQHIKAENPHISAAEIMQIIRQRMQQCLDEINDKLDKDSTRPTYPNPFLSKQ